MEGFRDVALSRLALVMVLSGLVACQAVRWAFVLAYADAAPQVAAKLWPNHPDVLTSVALTAIGEAAASGKGPPSEALQRLSQTAALAPLTAEPFLARGIKAREVGHSALARRAFLAARQRAPRGAAPRFLLADQYFADGESLRGLEELSALARLLPNGAISVAPALGNYARSGADRLPIRAAFKANPTLEQAVLLELAKDYRNADVILSLASSLRSPDTGAHDWVKGLINQLVEAGEFIRARQVWARASGVRAAAGLFEGDFRGSDAPPPFNWTLLSDSRGFAERDRTGGLRVTFYGRENATLVSQLLILPPGTYQLRGNGGGDAKGTLAWTLSCLPGNNVLKTVPVDGPLTSPFVVDSGCLAQRLDLKGEAADLPEEVEITLRNLAVMRLTDGR